MASETYTNVGVSTLKGVQKFRVCNGDAADRIKVLTRSGFTDIDLVPLPEPMSKLDAIAWFKAQRPEFAHLAEPNQPKVKEPKAPKAKKEPKAKKAKAETEAAAETAEAEVEVTVELPVAETVETESTETVEA